MIALLFKLALILFAAASAIAVQIKGPLKKWLVLGVALLNGPALILLYLSGKTGLMALLLTLIALPVLLKPLTQRDDTLI